YDDFVVAFGAAASVVSLTTGCGGALVPTLAASSPVLGGTASLAVANAAVGANGALFFALPSPTPLVLGAGCVVALDLATLQLFAPFVVDGTGGWGTSVPLPPSCGLAGLGLAFQAVVLDGAAPLGLALSDGLFVTLGF
ncbi:MAG TPA: hypothetical protein VEI02_08220, partial [Planctomycetota bacterium]|nr:hypothetical protein [Planctomycetota bacterium]